MTPESLETYGPVPKDHYPALSIRDLNRTLEILKYHPGLRPKMTLFNEMQALESIVAKRLAHPVTIAPVYRKSSAAPMPKKPSAAARSLQPA
jgi:hypothetical protein